MVEENSEAKLAGPLSPRSPVIAIKPPSPRSPPRPPRRIKLSDQQLETTAKEELAAKWREQDLYVECLESQTATQEGELSRLKKSEEKYRQKYSESSQREKILVRRLASKEQELQEYVNQITEMKAAQAPSASALRSALLDPAVNILIQKLRQELITTKAKLEDTQNELSAWKFTPDSNTGKRLMAKCRLLYQENEELGRMIASGRIAKLEGELALQRSFSEEVKKSQSELDEFLQDLDEDVEGMQSTIYFLQQELRKARESVTLLQQENLSLKSNTSELSLPNGLSPHTPPTKKEEDEDNEESKSVKSNMVIKMEVDSEEQCDDINSVDTSLVPVEKVEKKTEVVTCSEGSYHKDINSSDSTSSVIKVKDEELVDKKFKKVKINKDKVKNEEPADETDNDNDKRENDGDGENKICTNILKTKGDDDKSLMISGDTETNGGDETKTNLIKGRERTKRDSCDQGSDSECDTVLKKKRRGSVLSLDYNEANDDTLVITNTEKIQSDVE